MGLTAESRALIEILQSKTQAAWRDRELTIWFRAEGTRFGSGESRFVSRAFEEAVDGFVGVLLGERSLEEYRALVAQQGEPEG